MLEHNADVNLFSPRHSFDDSALQAASAAGHDLVVQLLIDYGANVNAEGGEYGFALHAVCAHGYGRVVQMLLTEGADVNA